MRELTVKPVTTDLFYQVVFKEPIAEILKGGALIDLSVRVAKAFGLRLDNVKLNNDQVSGNFIHFSVFDGPTYFDVSFGLEQASARLSAPQSEEQVTSLHGRLFQFFENSAIISQQMNMQQQLSSTGDTKAYLASLNPVIPVSLEKYLDGRGVFYTLKIPEHDLTVHITLVSSLFVPGGLFFSIENSFRPNKYDFTCAFQVARKYHDLILTELDLKKVLEASNGA